MSDLILHYERIGRSEAIGRLLDTVSRALSIADRPETRLRGYPSTYDDLARRGLSWFRLHRYWFGCRHDGTEMVVTHVLFGQANIPGRLRN